MKLRARDWRSIVVAFLLFGACGVLVVRGLAAAADPALPVDDAYISFSYARTLAAGGGLRLTPAAHSVEGFSNPAWVAILSLAAGLGSSIPPTAVLLSLLAAVATVIAVFGTARLLVKERWLPLLAAWAFALAPGVGFHVAAGLETLVAGLALLLAFVSLVSAPPGAMDPRTAVALLALALLRPEGVLVFLAWMVLLRRSGRRSTAGVLVFTIPFGAFLIFRWAYFGQLVPNSVAAKMGLDALTALRLGLDYLLEFAGRNAPVIALGAAGMWWARRREALAALSACATLALLALGGAHADGYPHQRYLFPLLPILLVFAARGARSFFELGERRGRSGIAVAAAGLVLAVGAQATLWGIADPAVGRARLALFDGGHARLEAAAQATRRLIAGDRLRPEVSQPPYHQLAAWLLDRARPGQLVAMQEIGITSYYSGLEVLDTYGLADSRIAQVQGPPSGKAAPDVRVRTSTGILRHPPRRRRTPAGAARRPRVRDRSPEWRSSIRWRGGSPPPVPGSSPCSSGAPGWPPPSLWSTACRSRPDSPAPHLRTSEKPCSKRLPRRPPWRRPVACTSKAGSGVCSGTATMSRVPPRWRWTSPTTAPRCSK